MGEIQRKVVNGVNTVLMHGKAYVEVAERVRLVHDQKREFEVIESSPFVVGERCIWRVAVKVDGRLYTGNAEVKLNARSGPDATNPFECGETSALGRALAFAGFGSVESIASFDEVYRATNNTTEPSNDTTPQQPTNSVTKPTTARPTVQATTPTAVKPPVVNPSTNNGTTNGATQPATKTSSPNETHKSSDIKTSEGQSPTFTGNSHDPVGDLKNKAIKQKFIEGKDKTELAERWKQRLRAICGREVTDEELKGSQELQTKVREAIDRYNQQRNQPMPEPLTGNAVELAKEYRAILDRKVDGKYATDEDAQRAIDIGEEMHELGYQINAQRQWVKEVVTQK